MSSERVHTVSSIEDPLLSELVAEGGSDDEFSVIARLRDTQNLPNGVRIVTQFGDIATLRVRRSQVNELAECNSVMGVEASRRLSESQEQTDLRHDVAYPDLLVNSQMADQHRSLVTDSSTRRPAGLTATGRGCVVAVLDWGCDFVHPAFRDRRGETRLLAIWDQRGNDGDGPGNRWGYGRIHDAERINHALQSRQPYAALEYDPADSDRRSSRTKKWTGAHGTHVLDIAAGTSRSNNGGGVAPDAELIFVHLARTTNPLGTGNLGDSASILEALDFVFRTAGERPCVVNVSVGAMGNPHDGSSYVEHCIDNAVRLEPGRCVVNSGGNYFNKSAHAQGRLVQGGETALTFDVPPRDPTDSELEVWYPGVDRITAVLTDPDGNQIASSPHGSRVVLRQNDQVVGKIHHISRSNGDNSIDVFLKPQVSAGRWNLMLRGTSIGDGHYHAWIERDSGKQPVFVGDDVVGESTTGSISNGQFSITVGAYDSRGQNLEIGRFSSSGPTRDGRIKPELIAPGVAISAARSTPRGRTPGDRNVRKSGTSMAAPHVAGTVAVMFEAAGTHLSILDTRRLLFNSVNRDVLTTLQTAMEQPHRFGYGVLAPIEAERVSRSWSARHANHRIRHGDVNEQLSAMDSFEIDEFAETPLYSANQPAKSNQQAETNDSAELIYADNWLIEEGDEDESKEAGKDSLTDKEQEYSHTSARNYESHENHFMDVEPYLEQQLGDQMLGEDQDFTDVNSECLYADDANDNESDEQFLQIDRSEMATETATEKHHEGISLEPFRNALLGSLANELVRNVSELHRTAFDVMGIDESADIEAVATPAERLQHPARPGDILQRVLPGESVYSSVIVSDEPEEAESLARRGVPIESGYGGAYVEVIEVAPGGGQVQSIGRRLTDANGRLPYGQTLLRANLHTEVQESFNHVEILPFSPPDPWCLLRRRIASVAQAELLRWRRADGSIITEGVRSRLPILREYWRTVPGRSSDRESLRLARLSAANGNDGPWSAAFICFVMRTAGVLPTNGFVYGGKHIRYIVGALRNRENSDRSRPFWLLDSEEMQVQEPKPGDLVCLNRRYRDRNTRRWRWTTHSYASLRRQFWPTTRRNRVPWGHSHCALVVGRGTENGQPVVYTIGGNEGNSVMRRTVVLNQHGGVLNPVQNHFFGLIKLTMCSHNRNILVPAAIPAAVPVPAVRARLQRLNLDAERIQILVDHLQEREGNYSHFYCDHNGFVTIGIGHLVDRRGEPDNVGQGLARALSAEVNFTNQRTGARATVAAVVADWQRIKDLYRDRIRRGRRPGGAPTYSGTARLRITEAEGRQLSETKYTILINRFYRKRPALLRLDNYITMAMVDARYNPAGIQIFGNRDRIPDLWAALDSNDPAFNLDEALRLFQSIWRNRGRARYRERHQTRVSWFRLGVAAMRVP